MTLFEEFSRMFHDAVLRKGKKLIIGGYDQSGAYCNWLINHSTGEDADMILDDSLCVYGVKAYRELALSHINGEEYLGIVFDDGKYARMFEQHGIEWVSMKDVFGCEQFGFYEWLEAKFGVDFIKTIAKEDFDYDGSLATNSGVSRQMGLMNVLRSLERFSFINRKMKALDVGCGKGGAIEVLSQSVFKSVDGVEMSNSICGIAKKNMELLGNKAKIMNVSATEFESYGEYDALYLYDPFRGDVFRAALAKIEEAARSRQKPMLLVYANPYHHKDIIEGGVFRHFMTVDTDFFHRNVYVYRSKGAE